jgi:hypothetical protein
MAYRKPEELEKGLEKNWHEMPRAFGNGLGKNRHESSTASGAIVLIRVEADDEMTTRGTIRGIVNYVTCFSRCVQL